MKTGLQCCSCGGSGKVDLPERNMGTGTMPAQVGVTCPSCHGTGERPATLDDIYLVLSEILAALKSRS